MIGIIVTFYRIHVKALPRFKSSVTQAKVHVLDYSEVSFWMSSI